MARRAHRSGSRTARRGARVESLAIEIRSSVALRPALRRTLRERVARRIGWLSSVVDRATVRFEDVNGPRGGVDISCRIAIAVAGRPPLVVEKRAATAPLAFAAALPAVGTALERMAGKHRLRGARPVRRAATTHRPEARAPALDAGEIIGRRVGRGPEALARALERPEKRDRAAYVDTAAPGVSATHRRAGGGASARRNTRARTSRATATLEDSRTRPSRKSTRRSANRGKPSQTKERAALAAATTPSARAARRG